MKEYRPLNPPEEVEEITYTKCDHCEDSFKDGQILTLPWGHYCKDCCDIYVEDNILEGDDYYQNQSDIELFKEKYVETFKLNYK